MRCRPRGREELAEQAGPWQTCPRTHAASTLDLQAPDGAWGLVASQGSSAPAGGPGAGVSLQPGSPRSGSQAPLRRAEPRPCPGERSPSPTADRGGPWPLWGWRCPQAPLFLGLGRWSWGQWEGAAASETPLFISPSIWFLGISFNKPVLTHDEPGAGLRGPLPRRQRLDLLGLRWGWARSSIWRERWEPGTRKDPPSPCLLSSHLCRLLTQHLGQPPPWQEHHPGWPRPGHSGDFQFLVTPLTSSSWSLC